MEIRRQRFQGVLNILSFNRHFYVFGIASLVLIFASTYLIDWNDTLFWIIIIAFLYGLIMPLVVSAYVYDLSGFYKFNWLKGMNLVDDEYRLNVNINAGFDETSHILKHVLPKAALQAYDFYDSKRHTEPAIVRARKVSIVYPNTQQISSEEIPLKDQSVDHIFLISAIHEIRSHAEKVQFLKECKRVCKSDGSVVMVEHLRDFPNFLAFTIGFTHFFSKATWNKAFAAAGFTTVRESKFTPFMSVFKCQ